MRTGVVACISYPAYFEYEISPLGYELPILIPNFDGKFLGWRPEVFVPYELLRPLQNLPPRSGTQWRGNFYRMDYDKGQTTSWYWSPVGSNFHNFREFGTLVFE